MNRIKKYYHLPLSGGNKITIVFDGSPIKADFEIIQRWLSLAENGLTGNGKDIDREEVNEKIC